MKKICSMAVVIIIVLLSIMNGLIAFAEKENSPSPWAITEIQQAKEYELVTEKVLSDYQGNVTREEFSELAVKLYEKLSGEKATPKYPNPFVDTDNEEILKANNLGIVNGIGDGKFAPNNSVTREQIATMFFRTLKVAVSNIETNANDLNFSDKDQIANWALAPLNFMNDRGIMGGIGDNKLDPKGTATKEQAIALVKRTYEKFKDLKVNNSNLIVEDNNELNVRSYTFMVYLNGADLESEYYEEYDSYSSAATDDLKEMMEVGSNENLNVIVETGGTSHWTNSAIDATQNQRWLIKKGELEKLADIGNKNIGDPQTLTDFIVWTVENYPAEKYFLDFWNHGGGPLIGFGVDELNNFDGLTLNEIQKALDDAYEKTGVKFEAIGFDACLMASLETAHIISPYAKYLVASEEVEPGHGWNYTPILEEIIENPNIDGKDLGRIIADSFYNQAKQWGTNDSITLSVINLGEIDKVVKALDDLVLELEDYISEPERLKIVSKGRSKAEAYGGNSNHEGFSEIIDLSDFARNISEEYTEAKTLIKAIEDAVVYKVQGSTRQYGKGLSIYFPYKNKANFDASLKEYNKVNFSQTYKNFLEKYTDELEEDTGGVILESTELFETDDGFYGITINEDDRENIEHIYCILGVYLDESEEIILNLGMDNDVNYDFDTGVASDNFSGWWVGLNGNFVSLNIVEETEEYNLYTIPAILNGEEVDILASWIWDDNDESGGYYEVYGAWRGIDANTQMPDKNLIEIKDGDKITPIFTYYLESTGETGFVEGQEFTVEEALKLEDMPLPTGNYLYGFYVTDYSQNQVLSDFTVIELTE